jgi:lipopolysaccharide transport system ATP-binding protein
MSSDCAIQVDGLGKAYLIFRRPEDRLRQMIFRRRRYFEEYWALRDVGLTVRKGEAVAIIGRNGSGKSTFLQLVCGTLTPTTGTVRVKGRVAALLELGAGFNPEFTGRENVYLSASVLGLGNEEIESRFDAIANFAAIGDFMEQPVKLYSSGMYARLAFAVVAHVDPDILIVDEILAVGDAAFTQKCMRFIRRFLDRGTLLFVSHDVSSVLSLCERAVWLEAGGVRESGPAKDVCTSYIAAIEGEKESDSAFRIGGTRKTPPSPRELDPVRDVREGKFRELGIVPQAEVFHFDPDAPWFGCRGASIEDVRMTDLDGRPLQSFTGGEDIVLRVNAIAHEDVRHPIVGFMVKDRLGQIVFGDNTFLSRSNVELGAPAGSRIVAGFEFRVPYLPAGDYAVAAAIADGTQEDHVQHHWVDEAFFFRVIAPAAVKGLVGIPMRAIHLDVVGPPSS